MRVLLIAALLLPLVTSAVIALRAALIPRAGEPVPQAEIVVVLGGGVEDGALKGASARRVRAAVEMLAPNQRLHFTGGLPDPIAEAIAMARLAEELGVEPGRISVESESRNTIQNALFSREQLAGRRLALVSSGFHLPRAQLLFGIAGLDVVALRRAESAVLWRRAWSYLREGLSFWLNLGRIGAWRLGLIDYSRS